MSTRLSRRESRSRQATDAGKVVRTLDPVIKEKLKLLEDTPIFCVYSRHFGVWRVHMPDQNLVIIHDAKHYPGARVLENFYKELGFNVYRLNTDIMGEDKIARELLAYCRRMQRIFKY